MLAGDGGITETIGDERQGVKATRYAAGRVTVQVRDASMGRAGMFKNDTVDIAGAQMFSFMTSGCKR